MFAAAASAFIRGRSLFGGAAACSNLLKSSCCWGWGWGRGRGYVSQTLPNPDHSSQNKILPQTRFQIGYLIQKLPWLMLSSTTKPESRHFYDLLALGAGGGQLQAQDGDAGMPLIALNREIDLPQIASHRCVGSSQGFLFTIDRDAEIHATNPLNGDRLPLPSTGTLPNMSGVVRDPATGDIKYYVSSVDTAESPEITRLVYEDNAGTTSPLVSLNHGYMEHIEYMRHGYYKKLTLSPSLRTAVAIHCPRRPEPHMGGQRQERLAFARLGGDDTSSSWTDLPWSDYSFNDIIFHKGWLHAVDSYGTLYVYDINNPSAEPSVSPEGPLLHECTTRGMYVVESEDGNDLFLVFRDMFWENDDKPRTQGFKVFKLNKRYNKWNQVDSVGGLALFVGFNHTSSLSAHDVPGLKPNCIYFTDDYHNCVQNPQLFGDTGVYNLKDGTIQFFQPTDGLQELNWSPPPVWFVPVVYKSLSVL